MAPSTGTVLVHALAIASLFFCFLCNFYMQYFRGSHALPCVSYSALALSKVCSCVFRASHACHVCPILFLVLRNVSFIDSKALFAFHRTASSNAGFSFQSKGMSTLTKPISSRVSLAHTCTSVHVPHFISNK